MNSPFVSVIIPNYCHAPYLDQRIQSVLNQTYKNFEVIILDDCSPDDGASKAVIEKYRDNPHVSHIVYNETNSGSTFKQWNKGIGLSKGEYCWIAESDDYCEPILLETLVAQIGKYENVSVAYCIPQYVDKDGNIIKPVPESDEVEFYNGDKFVSNTMSYKSPIWNASAAIFRKKDVFEIDKSYMNFVAAGDRFFWILMAKKGNVVYVPKRLSWFRQHEIKVSPAKSRQGITDREDYRILRYLEQHGWMNWFDSIKARCHYLTYVKDREYESEEIRKDLLHMWSYNGKLPIGLFQFVGRCGMWVVSKIRALRG